MLRDIAWTAVLAIVIIVAVLVLVGLGLVSDQFVWAGVGAAIVMAILSLRE